MAREFNPILYNSGVPASLNGPGTFSQRPEDVFQTSPAIYHDLAGTGLVIVIPQGVRPGSALPHHQVSGFIFAHGIQA